MPIFSRRVVVSIRSNLLRAVAGPAAAAAAVMAMGGAAQGQLTLTPAGTAQSLGLTTFASGFGSSSNIGPLGIAFPADGGVLVTDVFGNVQRFARTTAADPAQNAPSVPVIATYGAYDGVGLATVGTHVYMTRQTSGVMVQLSAGYATIDHVVLPSFGHATGIVANPVSGHLYVSTYDGGAIADVDPVAGTSHVLVASSADGLSISPDGSILYAALGTGVLAGFNTTTGAQVFNGGFVPGGLDGTALGYGPLTGNIFANCNNGNVYEINLTTLAQTLIANGGSRGDFVTADPLNNGDLYITQTDRIIRLSGIPSPASLSLLGLGGLAMARRRR